MAVQFSLFNFANYSPSITFEPKVPQNLHANDQYQRSETNKYVS